MRDMDLCLSPALPRNRISVSSRGVVALGQIRSFESARVPDGRWPTGLHSPRPESSRPSYLWWITLWSCGAPSRKRLRYLVRTRRKASGAHQSQGACRATRRLPPAVHLQKTRSGR